MRWLLSFVLLLLALGTLRVVGCGDAGPCGDCGDGNPCTTEKCVFVVWTTRGTTGWQCDYNLVWDGTPCSSGCDSGKVCIEGVCTDVDSACLSRCTVSEECQFESFPRCINWCMKALSRDQSISSQCADARRGLNSCVGELTCAQYDAHISQSPWEAYPCKSEYDALCEPESECGNGVVEWAEKCDGTDLGLWVAWTCVDFGYTGGTLACNATCDDFDLTACTGGPPGWTCPVYYFDNWDVCNCGCGVFDPDCIDGTVASCESCNGTGSCSSLNCPGDIDPTQNWLCDG